MGLASLLLTGNEHGSPPTHSADVDDALDALFRSNPAPPIPSPSHRNVTTIPPSPAVVVTRGQKRKRKQETTNSQCVQPAVGPTVGMDEESPSEHVSSAGDDGDDSDLPQHETRTLPKKRITPRKKAKYVPPDETAAQRDARTIFVGNIPVGVAKSKSSQKQLKKHFTSHISSAKIESVRFRSVAFASATTALPSEDGKPPQSTAASTKQQRQKERAATWRDAGGETSDREEHGTSQKPSFLTPAEKKRVAFIKRDFHKEVDTLNAYIVFAHTPLDDEMGVLSPIEAARLAVALCDGSTFLDRTIRVDRVGQWRAGCGDEDHNGEMSDPRVTVFVGNLDFAAREEDLRVWFEGVVGQVRGPRGVADADADEREGNWVQRVRIVRDRDTQLGKGFAYVRFADRECVDEVLALDRESLKFAKRTLRVQRCKIVPSSGASTSKPKPSARASVAPKHTGVKPVIVSVPAGDPLLGQKLAGLSKEDRKAAKAANMDRVQRRLAKKKASAGVQRELQKGGKVRERERKKGGKADKAKPARKGRARGEKSVEKRNMKK